MQLVGIVDKSRLKQEIKLLLYSTPPFVWNNTSREIRTVLKGKDIDWEFFYKIARCQGVGELVYFNSKDLCENVFPEDIITLLRNGYYLSIFRNNCFLQELKSLSVRLKESRIRFVLLKGAVFNNSTYPDGFTRDMQDVDILIEEKEFTRVKGVLASLGYNIAGGASKPAKGANFVEFSRYDASKDFDFVVDLQWGSGACFRDANKNGLSDLWQRTRFVQMDSFKLECMSPEDMLFNLFFHQRRFGMPFNLKGIFDIACIVKKYEKDIDWGFVIARAKSNRIIYLAFFCLVLANEIFGSFCPFHLLQNISPGCIRRKFFAYFFVRSLDYVGSGENKEMSNPYFAFMSIFFYDSIKDLMFYANSISFRQFTRFCKLDSRLPISKILFRFKLLVLPILACFKFCAQR